MTTETERQVLENLRRIDWLATSIDASTDYWVHARRIRQEVKDTIAMIENDKNQPEDRQ